MEVIQIPSIGKTHMFIVVDKGEQKTEVMTSMLRMRSQGTKTTFVVMTSCFG